jgi:hypothetical protein
MKPGDRAHGGVNDLVLGAVGVNQFGLGFVVTLIRKGTGLSLQTVPGLRRPGGWPGEGRGVMVSRNSVMGGPGSKHGGR